MPITNSTRPDDGFGENYKMLLCTMMYAELNGIEFRYSPFIKMDHNYDNDPNFMDKKEWLINMRDNIPLTDETCKPIHHFQLLSFYENNLDLCSQTDALKKARSLFLANKENPFKDGFNIAVHIRRENQHDRTRIGADVPNAVYQSIISMLKKHYKNAIIHIYSQGNIDDFRIFGNDIKLHINEPLEDTFIQMVYADALVTAPSALSYSAALISTGDIWYIQFCNPPLKHWNVITGYKSTRMRHEFVMPIPTPVFYDPKTGDITISRRDTS